METITIIHEIQRLPFTKQIYIAEWIIKSIRHRETKTQMEIAAEKLYKDYLNDKELTVFTNLDFENFYETAK
jgi:hypothetical protein